MRNNFSLLQPRMPIGPAFGVEIVIIFAAVVTHKVEYRGYADDQEVQRSENFGINSVTVQLVPNRLLVVGTGGTDQGKTAQRNATRPLRHPGLQRKAIVSVGNHTFCFRKEHNQQCHNILRKLPDKEQDKDNGV